jgi:hypothetical protein
MRNPTGGEYDSAPTVSRTAGGSRPGTVAETGVGPGPGRGAARPSVTVPSPEATPPLGYTVTLPVEGVVPEAVATMLAKNSPSALRAFPVAAPARTGSGRTKTKKRKIRKRVVNHLGIQQACAKLTLSTRPDWPL